MINSKSESSVYEVPLHNIQPDSGIDVYDEIESYNLDYQAISLSSVKLGSGQFGNVWKGSLNKIGRTLTVAVKIVKGSKNFLAVADLQQEIENLKQVGFHPNVVQLHGYCIHNDCLYIVNEYMPGGDLRYFLHKARNFPQHSNINSNQKNPLTEIDLLHFASDVANGMAHLASRQIIHRDLAARNILLDSRNVAKVSDFGFARTGEVYFKSSKTNIPARWMAIESLLENKFTTESNVWSFGVVLWEMTTLGDTPFIGLNGSDIIERLKKGERLPKPESCSQEMYDIMLKCWLKYPKNRPTFQELSNDLQLMLDDRKVYINLELGIEDKSIYEDYAP